jgi:hypothetical protein
MCNYPAFSKGKLLRATGYRATDKSIKGNTWLRMLNLFVDRFLHVGDLNAHYPPPLGGNPYACIEGNKIFTAIESQTYELKSKGI